jgi:hypothetical protein
MSFIQPFLDYMLNFICDHGLDAYYYIINWISYLIQKYGSKTKRALVIDGIQGTSKNKFFADVISKLFRCYAI